MTGEDRSTGGEALDRRRFIQTAGVATASVALGASAVSGQSGSGVSSTDITIESWDGTSIATTLYTPAENSPQPAILMTHGWGGDRSMTASSAERYARSGYVVLTYDSRGFGESQGTVTTNGPNEIQDGQALIDWLARREEVALAGEGNPRLGMDGGSYAGGIQLLLAANDNRVDAIVPRITWNDMNYSLAPNDVVKIQWSELLLEGATSGSDTQIDPRQTEFLDQTRQNNEIPGGMRDYYRQRSLDAHIDGFETPTLLLQGWDDSLFTPLEATWTYQALQDRGVESGLCFHPGGHALSLSGLLGAGNSGDFTDDLALSWLDTHLRDADEEIAPVNAWSRQDEEFQSEDAVPPSGVSTQQFSLDNASTAAGHSDTLQQGGFGATDTATYSWTVDQSVEIFGTPKIDVSFDVDGPEGIVYFYLQHDGERIHRYGTPYRLRGSGTQRATLSFPTLQRSLGSGDEFALEISVTDDMFIDSEVSEGVTVRPADSSIDVPTRADGSGTSGSSGASDTGSFWGSDSGSSSGSDGFWGSDGGSDSGSFWGSGGSSDSGGFWGSGGRSDSGSFWGSGGSSGSGSGWL